MTVADWKLNSFDLIWSDPFPYTKITEIKSEKCVGLDWMPEDL